MPKTRAGNVIAKEVRFELTHGATPSTCEAVYPGIMPNFPPGRLFAMRIGQNDWFGKINEQVIGKSNDQGYVTRYRAWDLRDELLSDVVFAQINMIDEFDGRVYCIVDEGTNLLDGSEDWLHQVPTYEYVPPRAIVEWLAALRGFQVAYSVAALQTLADTEGTDWLNSRYNVYNLDWNSGQKIGVAIEQVLTQLGLQMTMIMNLPADITDPINVAQMRWIHVSKVGDDDYANLTPDVSYANEAEDGGAISPDVDTGVYIVGDRSLIELTDQPLIPGWNELWNDYGKSSNKLRTDCASVGLSPEWNTVDEFAAAFNAALLHEGYLGSTPRYKKKFNGKAFNDMTCNEYAMLVGRLYRISGLQDWMTTDEYNCDHPPREAPIATPLLSDPARHYIVKGRTRDHRDKNVYWTASDTFIEKENGWHVDEHDGYVLFDDQQLMAAAGYDGTPIKDIPLSAFYFDTPRITVVLKGPVFRLLIGRNYGVGEDDPRVGSKRVAGLRQAFVQSAGWTWTTDAQGRAEQPDDTEEYVRDGEKPAPQWAEEIGNTLIEPYRQRIPRSGSATWQGLAGHVPSGSISRVSVSCHWQTGITESVSFANDRADVDYEPQIELRRRIATQQQAREGEKKLNDRKRDALRRLAVQAASQDEKGRLNALGRMMHKAWNEHNYMSAANPGSEAFALGQGVAVSCDPTTGRPTIVPSDDLSDGDQRVSGVCMQACDGTDEEEVCVCTSGVFPAAVAEVVAEGDQLKYDSASGCLVKGSGPFKALAAVGAGETKLVPVQIGAGGAASSVTICRVASTGTLVLSGIPSDLDTDLVVLVEDDLILVKDNVSGNGVYKVKAGAWEAVEDVEIVAVKVGAVYARSMFAKTGAETWEALCQIVTRATVAATGALTLSGQQIIDGYSCSPGVQVVVNANGAANGVYIMRIGAWVKLTHISAAFVQQGTKHARTTWFHTGSNVWQGGGAYPI